MVPQATLDALDPHDILGVGREFTWEELKENYRRIAKVLHPDKGGSDQLFQYVTACFRQLAAEYQMRVGDRPFHELKAESRAFATRQAPPESARAPRGDDRDFSQRFNRLFNEHRLEDEETSYGYGGMMAASTKHREDISIAKKMDRYKPKRFHEAFEKEVPVTKDVVVYREPEATVAGKRLQYTELGSGRPDDFSGATRDGRGIVYTDYKKAYSEDQQRLVDAAALAAANRKQFKTVGEFEKYRDKRTQDPATEEEVMWRREQEERARQAEIDRVQRLRERDQRVALHHEKVSQLMLR